MTVTPFSLLIHHRLHLIETPFSVGSTIHALAPEEVAEPLRSKFRRKSEKMKTYRGVSLVPQLHI